MHNSDENYEVSAFPFNAGSVGGVTTRSSELIDPDVLEANGNGRYPLLFMERAENGNFLETNEIAKRALPCGDPDPKVRAVCRWRMIDLSMQRSLLLMSPYMGVVFTGTMVGMLCIWKAFVLARFVLSVLSLSLSQFFCVFPACHRS